MAFLAMFLLLLAFVAVSVPCSLKWRADGERKRLQAAYDQEQAAIAARCAGENDALAGGDLLKGLYGHFPPAPEFSPPSIALPATPGAEADDERIPTAELRKRVRAVRRQARKCASCGKAMPASRAALCKGCAGDFAAEVLAMYAAPAHSLGQAIVSMTGEVHQIVVPTVWDQKAQAVIPSVEQAIRDRRLAAAMAPTRGIVVADFGGRANTLSP